MLNELEIANLGPIRAAKVEFQPGMTAITGETGAGKSMLLNALGLIRGGATESMKVSSERSQAWAQAVFLSPESSAACRSAIEAGAQVEVEDGFGELYLSRQVPAHGRSKAILCGHTVPRSLLADISSQLIAIHGQSEQLTLVSAAKQRSFLDAYARNGQERAAYAAAWQAYQALSDRLAALSSQQADVLQRADYLREAIATIDRVDPQPGEIEQLTEQRTRIENAAQIAQAVSGALLALDSSQLMEMEESASVQALLARAVDALRSGPAIAELSQAAEQLDGLSVAVSDVVFALSGLLSPDEGEQGDLDQINERIHELTELTRRWGPGLDEVDTWRQQAAFELEDMDASPEKLARLEAERQAAGLAARQAADRLSQTRAQAAAALCEQVNQELAALAMGGASLSIEVTRSELSAAGGDAVDFLFTPFPGAGRLPMGKTASGGELSRLMLALELSAASRGQSDTPDSFKTGSTTTDSTKEAAVEQNLPALTFVFDEVDAGVGGEAAVELGKRLAQLARSAQVVVVTHLAQVASWADAHYVVSKGQAATVTQGEDGDETSDGSAVQTKVSRVEGQARVKEIARMLSGSQTQASLQHASELLAESRL